jgi:nitronate monooxygenase
MDWLDLRHPIVAAPMAGGPSTVELVAAVSGAGGLGFLAAGYRSPEDLRQQIRGVRERTDAPFGVNVFVIADTPADPAALDRYAELLRAGASRRGLAVGTARADDDHFAEKIALLVEERVPVVSFVFGLPPRSAVDALHEAGARVLVTVTTADEAAVAVGAGADAVIAQGVEAGAHRGGFADVDGVGEYGILPLIRLVARAVRVPIVAAGGIGDGAGVAAVLAAGAVAAQLGTAFLRCPEAGTTALHRAALDRATSQATPTQLTRAFTGRRARALVNRFVSEYSAVAPAAFPHVHYLTAALRASGDPELAHLWAGQAYPLGTALPAAELVRRLAEEARTALAEAGRRLGPG